MQTMKLEETILNPLESTSDGDGLSHVFLAFLFFFRSNVHKTLNMPVIVQRMKDGVLLMQW